MQLPDERSRLGAASLNVAAWGIAVGYALLASLATALVLALRGGLPWVHPEPWLALPLLSSLGLSAGLGLGLGLGLQEPDPPEPPDEATLTIRVCDGETGTCLTP